MTTIQKSSLTFVLVFFLSLACRAQNHTPISYLALGDSYTIGEKVAEDQRWPVQLVDSLQKKGIAIKDFRIIAKTGWTTLDLQQAIRKADLKPSYDLVSLLIGVNDQYQNFAINQYPKRFSALLNKALKLAANNPDRVFVLSIPDYGVTPFGKKKAPHQISREIKAYNKISKSISDSLGVHYINITPISKRAEHDQSLLAKDGLHPSGKMYKHWVDNLFPILFSEIKALPKK